MRTSLLACCASVVLLAGCAENTAESPEAAAGSQGTASRASSAGSSIDGPSTTPVNPKRTPQELLREAVEQASLPEPVRVRGTVTMDGATLLKLYAEDDPGDGEPSRYLVVAALRSRRAPLVGRTVVAEGEIYLRRPGLPTQPGRPWLHVPDRQLPAGLDDWEKLRDLTQPATHLDALAARGTGLSRRDVTYQVSRAVLVHGRLAAPYLPTGICEGDGSRRLRPDGVRISVWLSGGSVDKLRIDCAYDNLPTVTWSSRYSYLGPMTMAPPPRRRVSEPSYLTPVSPEAA